ncbi:hypothetical protein SAMN04487995_3228 [Dyadobacter koreensis]|uniref:Uncharacterized protein n=1 Tax=Dyadobacter koreensis TaxID=408657 RepID=A0A1H6WC34_9BACT|nr:hypothetical protein SAMN04487995_3228 [Dyadobacter koreensis]
MVKSCGSIFNNTNLPVIDIAFFFETFYAIGENGVKILKSEE